MLSNLQLNTNIILNDVERYDSKKFKVIDKKNIDILKTPEEVPEDYLIDKLVETQVVNSGLYNLSPFCFDIESVFNKVKLHTGQEITWGEAFKRREAGEEVIIQDSFSTFSRIKSVSRNGVSPVFRYTTDKGIIFDVTETHRFGTLVDGKFEKHPIEDLYRENKLIYLFQNEYPLGDYIPNKDSLVFPSDLQPGEWLKHIENFENEFGITNFGRVWCFNRLVVYSTSSGKEVSNRTKARWVDPIWNAKRKHLTVGLYCRDYSVEHLVAQHFILNPEDYTETHFIDGNPQNVSYLNLEWCSSIPEPKNGNSKFKKYEAPKYIGVTHIPDRPEQNKWLTLCKNSGKAVLVGFYKTEQQAALAYDEYVKHYELGYPLNFGDLVPPLPKCMALEDQPYTPLRIISKEFLHDVEVGNWEMDNDFKAFLCNGVLNSQSFNWNQFDKTYSLLSIFKRFSNSVALSSCHVLDSDFNNVRLASGQTVNFRALADLVGTEIYTGFNSTTRIKAFKKNGFKEAFRYVTEQNRTFDVTEDHKFPTIIDGVAVERSIQEIYGSCLPLIVDDYSTIKVPSRDTQGNFLEYPLDLKEGEHLKHIEGFEGLYGITNYGRVWAFNKHTIKYKVSKKIEAQWLSLSETKEGFPRVTLEKGKSNVFIVHRLVSTHFLPNGLSFQRINTNIPFNYLDIPYDYIQSRESLGMKEVGDIQVEAENELYLINNVKVHNCRVDSIARDPHLAKLIDYFGSANMTVAVEGISQGIRNFLQKSLLETELYRGFNNIIQAGFNTIKVYYIYCGNETEEDLQEFEEFLIKLDELKKMNNRPTLNIRMSFTPLLSTLGTPIQYHPSNLSRSLKADQATIYKIKQICSRQGFPVRLSTSIPASEFAQIIEFTDRRAAPLFTYGALNGIATFPKFSVNFYSGEKEVTKKVFDTLKCDRKLAMGKSFYRLESLDKVTSLKLYSYINEQQLFGEITIFDILREVKNCNGKVVSEFILKAFSGPRRDTIEGKKVYVTEYEGEDHVYTYKNGKKVFNFKGDTSMSEISVDIFKTYLPIVTNGVTYTDIIDQKDALYIFPNNHSRFHKAQHIGSNFRQYMDNKAQLFNSYCLKTAIGHCCPFTQKVKVRYRTTQDSKVTTKYVPYVESN